MTQCPSTLPKPVQLWSANYDGANGQAIVTRRVAEAQPGIQWHMSIYQGGKLRALPSLLAACARLYANLLSGRSKTIYIVCSRSIVGFMRDIPALLPAVFGARVLIHTHGSDIINLLSEKSISRLARFFYRRCEVIVPSRHLVVPLAALGIRQVHLCENFVMDAAPVSYELMTPVGGDMSILWNSNVVASKGVFDLAEGVRLARSHGHPLKLIVIGKPIGDAEMSVTQIMQRLEALSLVPWFSYLGPVKPTCATSLLYDADIVALPSRYPSECQPLAIIQAMCEGKQVIVNDTPALRSTIGDYPATIVEQPTAQALADALSSELTLRYTNLAARRKAADESRIRFSIEHFDTRMAEILSAQSFKRII